MKKNDKIFVKLQIEKDESSGELMLNIHFDKDTPNFVTDKDVISWCPTIEEINFVNEAFEMISKGKNYNQEKKVNENNTGPYEEKKTDDYSNEEKVDNSKPEKEDKVNEEDSTISNTEKQEVNEWFV
jgi:hypothetical protein